MDENYKLELVNKVFDSASILEQLSGLSDTEKLELAKAVCAQLAARLDETKDATLPEITIVGKFLQQCSLEHILAAIKAEIKIDRLVEYNLDEHPEWSKFIDDINNMVKSTEK